MMDSLRPSAHKGRFAGIPLVFVLLVVLAATGCGSDQKPGDRPAAQVSQADSPPSSTDEDSDTSDDAIGFETSMAGWYGDTAVIEELEWYDSGETSETFRLLHTDGSYVSWTGNPDELQQGKELEVEPDSMGSGPGIQLFLDVDTVALRAMEDKLSALSPTDELPDPVPAVGILVWSGVDGTRPDTLMQDSIEIGAYYGDAAIEYRQPYISLAELSPRNVTLIVGIRITDEDDFHVFDVTSRSHR